MSLRILYSASHFLRLIRWFHEALGLFPFITLYAILSVKLGEHSTDQSIDHMKFFLAACNVIAIMVCGFILNDLIDEKIDAINKPKTRVINNKIPARTAWTLFACFSVASISLIMYIGQHLDPNWFWIGGVAGTFSILYSTHFKRSPMIGNIVIASLSAGVPLTLLSIAKQELSILHETNLELLIWLYAILPFIVILPRELLLDISDMEGDRREGCKTLPILVGEIRSKQIVNFLLLTSSVVQLWIAYDKPFLAKLFLFGSIFTLLLCYFVRKAEERIEYIRVGRIMWLHLIIMVLGSTILCL